MPRLIGIDPGLRYTGWGVIDVEGNHMRHVASGVIGSDGDESVPHRLCELHGALTALIKEYAPQEAAVEETYVNRNGASTLKLGYARGVALLVPAYEGLIVAEYGAKQVKKSVVGTGAATKEQVTLMIMRLLPGAIIKKADASDALAVAICHAHHRASHAAYAKGRRMA